MKTKGKLMKRIWLKKAWPSNLSHKLLYRLGERPLHDYLRSNAENHPNRVAYIYYGRSITWKELNQFSDSISNFMIAKGIKKGSRVVLFLQNCPQYIIAHFAIQKIGAITCPASPMFKELELEHEINDLGAEIIFTTDDLFPTVNRIQKKTPIRHVVTTNYSDFIKQDSAIRLPEELLKKRIKYPKTYNMQDLINSYRQQTPQINLDIWADVSLMVYTSGTTGLPKAAMLTYGNALFKAASYCQANEITEKDVWLVTNPIFHIGGMCVGMNASIYGGYKTVLLTRFDPETVITAIEKYRCNRWWSIVSMNIAVLNYPGSKRRKLNSLRFNTTTSFGSSLRSEVSQAWQKLTKGCLLYEGGYGLTETHTCDTFMPWENIRFGSVGIPSYDTDIKIVNPKTGKELGIGELGEIVIKNPGVFKGYWNNPEATKRVLRNGWVFTGDIGTIDEDGFLFFKGRLKEMIKCSGYSVFPEEIEMLLMNHPFIAQVGVIGIPDPIRGENIKAFIVLKNKYKGKITPQEIIDWSREHMANYKYPRSIEIRDSLAVTSSGKVLRRLLKSETPDYVQKNGRVKIANELVTTINLIRREEYGV